MFVRRGEHVTIFTILLIASPHALYTRACSLTFYDDESNRVWGRFQKIFE